MPIQFHCRQCGRLLQTPDDSIGRQAQCPQCGALTAVPTGSSESSPPSLMPERPWTNAPLSPSDPDAWSEASTGSPFGGREDANNPYQSPLTSQPLRDYIDAQAAARLDVPGMALIVVSILSIVVDVALFGLLVFAMTMDPPNPDPNPPPLAYMIAFGFVSYVLVPGIVSGLIIAGAAKMRGLRGYALAMTAAILALLPCHSCCLFTLPFGIWALVVLSDAGVRNAFRS